MMDDGMRLALFAACRRAISKVGGITNMARKLNNLDGGTLITKQAVFNWQQIPISRVRAVEEVTGISREVLRPDVFDEVES